MRKRPPMPSARATMRARPGLRCSKPAPASARRSAISRPPACGRRRTDRASGFRPTRAICSARSCRNWRGFIPIPLSAKTRRSCARAARIICACSISRKRQSAARWRPDSAALALGLVARWVAATADGDISGAGFPAFLAASFPVGEITDRRGECIYSACPHYRTCFIERAIRRSRHAAIVVANHALVIAQAARIGLPRTRPTIRRPNGACAMCSTKAIICSMRPIPVLRRSSPDRRWPICGAGSAGPRAARAAACAGSRNG